MRSIPIKHVFQRASMLLVILFAACGVLPFAPLRSAYACYNWSVGSRVGLRRGAELRQGSGTRYQVHTVVPEDNWPVDITNGPRSADGQQWWDISRRNIDGGGTGWVSIQQGSFDVCGGGSPAPQPVPTTVVNNVQLCEHDNYSGRCEAITGNDPNLGDNFVGNDTVTSVRVPAGRSVALYEHDNYYGKCTTITSDNPNIGNTSVGNDSVTAVQLDASCPASQPPPQPQPAPAPSVMQLCEHTEFRGACEPINGSDSDLRDNYIVGNDHASSLRVSGGHKAALYEHLDYNGRCQEFTSDVPSLVGSSIGNDTVTSLRVDEGCAPPPPPTNCNPTKYCAPREDGIVAMRRPSRVTPGVCPSQQDTDWLVTYNINDDSWRMADKSRIRFYGDSFKVQLGHDRTQINRITDTEIELCFGSGSLSENDAWSTWLWLR